MKKHIVWIAGFLGLYAVHAFFYLAFTDRLAVPISEEIARIASITSLVGLTLMVVAFIATRDEVMRKISMQAGAASLVSTAFISYGLSAFNIAAPIIVSNLWAVAIAVFLFSYGVLSWRMRS